MAHGDTTSQVIEWVSLLLDSRFSELVLLEDSHPIIERVAALTRTQMRMTKELNNFSAYLDQYRTNLKARQKLEMAKSLSALNSKQASTHDTYIIEVLYL